MKRIRGTAEALFGTAMSSKDPNRVYSILLDERASQVSETMFDVAEKLLTSEKENAKSSLENLWTLKKNMQSEAGSGTIDELIKFYQEKINALRNKEEHISHISRDSRKMLEEKQKKDSEIASVKQELGDCTLQMTELKTRHEKLAIREQELLLIGEQLRKDLQANENEIANGLYEIILARQRIVADSDDIHPAAQAPAPAEKPLIRVAPLESVQKPDALKIIRQPQIPPVPSDDPFTNVIKDTENVSGGNPDKVKPREQPAEVSYKQAEKPGPSPFPKSVVKTTKGRVIGEYYYDVKVDKSKRQYTLNSKYFLDQLSAGTEQLKGHFEQTVYAELLQMVQDAYKRISENAHLHFENATNEILNDKSLKEIWRTLKDKAYDDVLLFCSRLKARLDSLGQNYFTILKEQMQSLVKE